MLRLKRAAENPFFNPPYFAFVWGFLGGGFEGIRPSGQSPSMKTVAALPSPLPSSPLSLGPHAGAAVLANNPTRSWLARLNGFFRGSPLICMYQSKHGYFKI